MINKSEKRFSVKKEKLYHFLSVILNCYLALSAVIFLIYLVAPLFGGKLFPNALIVYGSWIGMALIMKFILKKMQKKVRMRGYECLYVCAYGVICMFLWFPYPFSILCSILIILGTVVGYKVQLKSSEFSNTPTDRQVG